jgi:hypothetical protein
VFAVEEVHQFEGSLVLEVAQTRVVAEQGDQVQEALKVEQARISMEFDLFVAVLAIALASFEFG